MARDPHETVDFAPAWLNFNNSNKKKSDKTTHVTQGFSTTLHPPLKSSQEPVFRTTSLGVVRGSSSPSRSAGSSVQWGHQSSNGRPSLRHQSVDFSHSDKNNTYPLSPGKEQKGQRSKFGNFSPIFCNSKRDESFLPRHQNRNGQVWLHNTSGTGDAVSGLDVEFPSLSDIDISDQSKSKQPQISATVVNMWEKPLILKKKEPESVANADQMHHRKSPLSSNIYRTLVPKSAPHQKLPYRRTMSVPLHLPSKSETPAGELITSGCKREHSAMGFQNQVNTTIKAAETNANFQRFTKTENCQAMTKPKSVDITVVSAHKKHRKGKSHFLKTLRQTESGDDSAGGVIFRGGSSESLRDDGSPRTLFEKEGPIRDISEDVYLARRYPDQTLDPFEDDADLTMTTSFGEQKNQSKWEISMLSSSLEAEHRLLREMGWEYSDDQSIEEPPLTEDEIREFFMQNKSNGLLSTPSSGHREKAFHNAFSGWKFPGIRKPSNDIDGGQRPNGHPHLFSSSTGSTHEDHLDSSDEGS